MAEQETEYRAHLLEDAGNDVSEAVVLEEQPEHVDLPFGTVEKIMREALPPDVRLSKEAILIVKEFLAEFIAFTFTEAIVTCDREGKKTITGDHLLEAMNKLSFDRYVAPLQLYLGKYRQSRQHRDEDEEVDWQMTG